ncbi:serine protease inhibitor [Glutamicibacter arilaitensis]|uniref:serine protease inhibitor n=1 Tax=Glutamicibacter arilaitensis TaxID=256701 RepID=UPI00384F5F32
MGRLKHQKVHTGLAFVAPLLAGLLLAGCASSAPTAGTSPVGAGADLKISISFEGKSVDSEYHLSCSGSQATGSSTLPESNAACALLAENPETLTPQRSPQQVCTEIYGGPATATVSGKFRGQQVDTTFDRHNGCAISEWDALAPLLGEGMK